MSYNFLSKLLEPQRLQELLASFEYDNHKSTATDLDNFQHHFLKDLKFGFALPIDKSTITNIPHCMVQPGGQFTLGLDGSRLPQRRLTHDLSFEHTCDNLSINNNLDLNKYLYMFYGTVYCVFCTLLSCFACATLLTRF